MRGLSSAGRAPALQAGGHRFDPDRLHHSRRFAASNGGKAHRRRGDRNQEYSRDEDTISCCKAGVRKGYFCCFFDIVNGFLIDAVVHWFASALSREVRGDVI